LKEENNEDINKKEIKIENNNNNIKIEDDKNLENENNKNIKIEKDKIFQKSKNKNSEKILDNSDVSVVYDSPSKNENKSIINDNELHEDTKEASKNVEENKEINKSNISKNETNNQVKKDNGFNMKIKTADGKEENWNIQV